MLATTQPHAYRVGVKTKYELVKRHTDYSPTPENGFGDYHTTTWERLAVVEAATEREARSAFKKLFPQLKLTFSGQFSRYHAWEVKP